MDYIAFWETVIIVGGEPCAIVAVAYDRGSRTVSKFRRIERVPDGFASLNGNIDHPPSPHSTKKLIYLSEILDSQMHTAPNEDSDE